MLPHSAESTCKHAVDALEQILDNADLHAVARGEPYAHANSAKGALSQLEESLVLQCRLVCEQASMLLNQLQAICAPGKTPSENDTSSLRFLDFPLFVRKSGLLRERVRRVRSTLSSLKHAGLLNEESLGRRIITERAFGALKELLDMILAVAATLATTPSTSVDLFQHIIPVKPPISAEHMRLSASSSDSRKTELQDRSTAEGVEGIEEVVSSVGSRYCIEKKSLCERATPATHQTGAKEKTEAHEINKVGDDADGIQTPSLAPQETLLPPGGALTSIASVPSSQHGDCGSSSASRNPRGDSMETIAAAHRIPLEELCAANAHLLAFRHNPLPPNTPVRIPKNKVASKTINDEIASARTTTHVRRFRGHLWRELIGGETNTNSGDASTTITTSDAGTGIVWKDIFSAEVGLLFGIPVQWVENVHFVDEKESGTSEGEVMVKFDVSLPASFEEDEIRVRVEQHEFIGMLILYEKFHEKKLLGYCGNESINEGLCSSLTGSCLGNSIADLGRTITPNRDSTSEVKKQGFNQCNVDNPPENVMVSPVHEVVPARDLMQMHQDSEGAITENGYKQSRCMVEQEQQRGVDTPKESLLLEPHMDESSVHQIPMDSAKPDAKCPRGLLLLPPRPATLNQGGFLQSLSAGHGGEKVGPSSFSLPVSPFRSCISEKDKENEGAADGGVNPDITGNGSESCYSGVTAFQNCSPIPATEKEVTGTQKIPDSPLLWFSTTHERVFHGDKWGVVLEHNEGELLSTFVKEISLLFELPEGNVRHVKFALGSLRVTFDLFHDRYLHETEINALLAVFDFPLIRGIYQRCAENSNASSLLQHVATEDSSIMNLELSINTSYHSDVNSERNTKGCDTNDQLLINKYMLKKDQSFIDNADDIPLETDKKEIPRVSGLQQHSPRLDTAATSENETVTFTRLAHLHDIPTSVFVQANPHLFMYGVDKPFSSSENVVIPRAVKNGVYDHHNDFLRNRKPVAVDDLYSKELLEVNPTQAQNSAPSHSADETQGTTISSEKCINLEKVEKEVGVMVSTLQQQNRHLDTYGFSDSLPMKSSTNAPTTLLAVPESGSGFSSITSSPRCSAAFTNCERSADTITITTRGGGRQTDPVSSLKNNLRKLTQKLSDDEECEKACGPQPMLSPPIPFSHPGSAATMRVKPLPSPKIQHKREDDRWASNPSLEKFSRTPHSAAQTDSPSISLDNAPRSHIAHSFPVMSTTSLHQEHAVLALSRCTKQFFLLRFFVKWRCFLGMRVGSRPRRRQPIGNVIRVSLGTDKKAGVVPVDFHSRSGSAKEMIGLLPRYVLSPRTGSVRGQRSGAVTSSTKAVAQTQSKNSSVSQLKKEHAQRRETPRRSSLGEPENTSSFPSARRPSLRRGFTGPNPPLSRTDGRTPTRSSSIILTPRNSCSRASSCRSVSRASSMDKRPKLSVSGKPTECLSLGLRFVPNSLVIKESQGEAAEAGIRHGDEVREVDGIHVRTGKEFCDAVASSISSHVTLTVVKRGSGALTALRVLCCGKNADTSFTDVSRKGLPLEPRITPAFGTERNCAPTFAGVQNRNEIVFHTRPQPVNVHYATRSRDLERFQEMRARRPQ